MAPSRKGQPKTWLRRGGIPYIIYIYRERERDRERERQGERERERERERDVDIIRSTFYIYIYIYIPNKIAIDGIWHLVVVYPIALRGSQLYWILIGSPLTGEYQ